MAMLQTFDAHVSPAELAASVAEHGYANSEGLLDSSATTALSEQLAPHLNATDLGDPDPFFGDKTKRFGALLSRCPLTQDLLTHQLILNTADRVLGPYCVRYQVNFTGAMHLTPGRLRRQCIATQASTPSKIQHLHLRWPRCGPQPISLWKMEPLELYQGAISGTMGGNPLIPRLCRLR